MPDHFLTDDGSIAEFLAARRKFIAGLLGILSLLVTGGLVPGTVGLIVQAIVGFLTVYGVHEVENTTAVR